MPTDYEIQKWEQAKRAAHLVTRLEVLESLNAPKQILQKEKRLLKEAAKRFGPGNAHWLARAGEFCQS